MAFSYKDLNHIEILHMFLSKGLQMIVDALCYNLNEVI